MNNRSISGLLLLTAVWFLSGCGDGTTLADGGMGGTGISYGTITEIGSIWVNGVKFDTTGAEVDIDGVTFTDNNGTSGGTELLPGMVVRVDGIINADGVSGTADSVSYRNSLEGPISAIDPAALTFTVLGQKVVVDNTTRFDNIAPADLGGLAVSDVVEVSGFITSGGDVYARYIEKTGSTDYELTGTVGTIVGPFSFTIGGLTIDTSGIGFDTALLTVDSSFVEVEGSSFGGGGELIATAVSVINVGLGVTDVDEAEVEGLVTEITTPLVGDVLEFILGAQPVVTDANTSYSGGLVADIQVGVHLEVEGSITGGVLTAEEIEFEDGIELEGDVATVGGSSLTLEGDLGSVTVEVNDTITEFSNVANLAGINVGDHLQIRARVNGGDVLATEIDWQGVVPPDSDVKLQGPVDVGGKGIDSITVLDVTVDTSSFDDPDDFIIEEDGVETTPGKATFYATLNEGDLVEFEGTWDGFTTTWDKVELDR